MTSEHGDFIKELSLERELRIYDNDIKYERMEIKKHRELLEELRMERKKINDKLNKLKEKESKDDSKKNNC